MKISRWAAIAVAITVCSSNAGAADLLRPSKAAAPAAVEDVAPAKSIWTGLYIEGGLGITSSTVDAGPIGGPTLLSIGDSAISGHVGIGYDHMLMPHIVVGVLARAQIDNLDYKAIDTSMADRDIEYMVGGRLGFVPRSDWMIYGLAGYRFANLDFVDQPNANQNGWVLGAGLEAMLTDHMFIGLEYTANLTGKDTVDVGTQKAPDLIDIGVTDHTGKARVGWKF